jgi:hypothetical protein
MTIDELAAFSQREYESIRNEMATREELRRRDEHPARHRRGWVAAFDVQLALERRI